MNSRIFTFCLAVDHTPDCTTSETLLNKVDKLSFSQQTLMEILIQDITNRHIITRALNSDTYPDISHWPEVTIENGDVTMINWCGIDLKGSIDIKWMPPTIERMVVTSADLEGTLNLTELPPPLRKLNLARNSFSGTISLKNLPNALHSLFLNFNKLTGTVCLTNLPQVLENLYLNNNQFYGPVDMTKLPHGMRDLRLSKNDFTKILWIQQHTDTEAK